MRWASAVSTAPSLADAIGEVTLLVGARLGGARPDLAVVFVSPHHADDYERVPTLIADRLAPRVLVGCSGGGVIGGGSEIENAPAVSVTAAVLPDVSVHAFHATPETCADSSGDADIWRGIIGLDAAPERQLLVLADPFSVDAEAFVRAIERVLPADRVVGGLASGGTEPSSHALFVDGRVHHAGVAGVALAGDVVLDTIVAQGCRPIGDPMFVTAAQRNVLHALDGQPAVSVLQDLYRDLDERDQKLARESLFLGVAMSDGRQQYRQGDFLIRNIAGIDAQAGALGIAAELREGLVVQFHLRDARTSAEDLEALLTAHGRADTARPSGALLFSCLGRGASLYGQPDHDSEAFRRHMGDVPLGGFFCNGEIGPVHGRTFVHGYTSAFGLFRPRS